jgi:hypothetical protein
MAGTFGKRRRHPLPADARGVVAEQRHQPIIARVMPGGTRQRAQSALRGDV